MKSLLNKLIFLTLVVSAWVVYDRWDSISQTFESTKKQISREISSIKNTEVKTTTVYKWKDKDGNWQFSNTRPENVPDAEVKQFRSDENILPPVSQTAKKKDEKQESGGIIESIKGSINEASGLKQNLETAKQAPAEWQILTIAW